MPDLVLDFLRQSYWFDLPEHLIAQQPAAQRTDSRLMVLPLQGGDMQLDTFANLLQHLPEKCLVVANNSRVIPARIFGSRKTGGKVELLLLTPLPVLQITVCSAEEQNENVGNLAGWSRAKAEVLLRSSKKVAVDEWVEFGPLLLAQVKERGDFGKCWVELLWRGSLQDILQEQGSLPLPPYIRRDGTTHAQADAERYQTSYARADKAGSVAAPTAGLHFTPELKEALVQSGRAWAEVTLYVGYGTFSPVREDDIRNHPMHAEYVELSEETAQAVRQAKKEGRPVIAVGTTSARVLEGVWQAQQSQQVQQAQHVVVELASVEQSLVVQPVGQTAMQESDECQLYAYTGWINIFLYPSRSFGVIDGLITNFHLPESSLLMLVSALAGRERILAAYARAVQEEFRFFSYGDAMLLV